MMIKIAFFDIDGTLVDFGTHAITPDSIQALDALRANGIKVFISSGRHKCVMDNLHDYRFDGYICTNGALILLDGKTIYSHPIDKDEAIAIATTLHQRQIPCIVYNDDGIWINFQNEASIATFEMLHINRPPETDIVELAQRPIYQFTPFVEEGQEWILKDCLKNSTPSRWYHTFMDINPGDINKAVAIGKVLEYYGFKREECIAFGDGGNDIQMLEYAGIGVAMGNAEDDVKSHADFVTTSIKNGGVTYALRHFNLI